MRTAFTLVVMLLAGRGVAADEGGPAYRLSFDLDAPMLLVGGALASSFFFLSEAGAVPACAPRCDPASVNGFDRFAAGNYDPTWGTVGDVTTAGVLVLLPLTLAIDEGAGPGMNDVVVVAEAALWASAIQVPISYAIQRPRPYVYGEGAPLGDRSEPNAGRSFFSGHVANCVAVTVATARTFLYRDRPALAWVTLALGLTGSALVGVARVGAGSHFPSDDLVGAAVGAGVGIAVPALHRSGVRVAPLAVAGGGGLVWSGEL